MTGFQAFLLALAIVGFVVGFTVGWVRRKLEAVPSTPLRELDPWQRAALEGTPSWCSQCRLTELVCDVHPRVAYEKCGCPDGVPRACPRCTEYDVTALLEEIANLRHRVTLRGQDNGSER